MFCLTVSAQAQAKVVTKAMGAVGDYIVTSREVQANYLLDQALSDKPSKVIKGIALDDADFNKQVTLVLIDQIVSLEADNFSLGQISSDEIQGAHSLVQKYLQKNKVWQSLEVSAEELDLFIKRRLKAKKFIRFKTESSAVAITDAEARDYYTKNRYKFGNLPFEDFKENIKAFLGQQQMEDRMREWFELLRRKYRVRNFEVEFQ